MTNVVMRDKPSIELVLKHTEEYGEMGGGGRQDKYRAKSMVMMVGNCRGHESAQSTNNRNRNDGVGDPNGCSSKKGKVWGKGTGQVRKMQELWAGRTLSFACQVEAIKTVLLPIILYTGIVFPLMWRQAAKES